MALITSTALAVFHEHGEYLCIPISKSFVETSCPVMQSSQHALQSSVGLLVFNASNNFWSSLNSEGAFLHAREPFFGGHSLQIRFFFPNRLSTRVPSTATMPFSHRPTLKQRNKPFKSGHATKGSLKRASKGTWNALQLSCVTDSRQVRTSQIPVVPSRLVRTKHMLFEQQAALRDRGRIEEMRRARCHNRSAPPLWKARVYFPAQACEGRHVHQVGDQVAIARQVHHVFVQYLPLHLMQRNGMLCGRWRTMARP